MSEKPACPKCQSSELRWLTFRRDVPIDTLQCQSCGVTLAEEDWMLPGLPMVAGRCINCGDRRDFDQCLNCGLNRDEDVQVHDELRQMVSPAHSLFDAARIANRAGRRLIALKLATAASVLSEGEQAQSARALRVWLLAAVGEAAAALDDAKVWVEKDPDPSAIAWASYGHQLQANAFPGAAADAYQKALRKDPTQHVIRARRAQLLMALHREGQAIDESTRVLESSRADAQAIEIALVVAEELCDLFETQLRNDEIGRLLSKAGPHTEKSAKLLGHRARLAATRGDMASAKRDLKKARRLDPEQEIYERVEKAMRPGGSGGSGSGSSSWWRW